MLDHVSRRSGPIDTLRRLAARTIFQWKETHPGRKEILRDVAEWVGGEAPDLRAATSYIEAHDMLAAAMSAARERMGDAWPAYNDRHPELGMALWHLEALAEPVFSFQAVGAHKTLHMIYRTKARSSLPAKVL